MIDPQGKLKGKRIILGVTGSIAAYKSVSLLRTLVQGGADVSVVMTKGAIRFVAPLTFEVLSKQPVAQDLFSGHQEMTHITWPEKADLIVLAPCTANRIAKYALGLADDLLSAMLLTTRCPVIIAPAMDGEMWDQPAANPSESAGWLALANFYYQGWDQYRPQTAHEPDADTAKQAATEMA